MISLKSTVRFVGASLMAVFFILPTSVLAIDVDSSRFIGDPSRIAKPDARSGAFTQSYAFTLPPGRNGMQPSLALSYSSMASDNASIVGYGWLLTTPFIERRAPHGVDELYTRNDFTSSLSGELTDITLSDTTHGTYGTKVDDGSYFSYTYNADETWSVVDKAGVTYTFGGEADARVTDPSDSTHVYRWMLTSVEDALGNNVTYTYTTDGNQVYPETINYTGFGTSAGIFDVDFTLESRSDAFTSYATGFAVTTSYRVSEIAVSVDSQEVRSYALEYSAGDNGIRSLLTSITETATTEDGTLSLTSPETTFTYQEGNESWSSASVTFPETIAGTTGSLGVYLFDMDGDAITDVVKSRPASQAISLGNGDGTWSSSTVLPPLEFSVSSGADKGVRIMDVNGDSALDVVYARLLSGTLIEAVYINNGDGTGWTEDAAYTVPIAFTSGSGANLGVDIFDVDGDGLPDIVKSRDSFSQEVYINNGDGTGWTQNTGYTVPVYFAGSSGLDLGVRPMDVNGDGLTDLVHSRDTTDAVYINNGDGTGWTEDTAWSVPVAFVTSGGWDMGVRPMDVNGDGLTDLVYHRTDGWVDYEGVYVNTGTSWTSTSLTTPLPFTNTYGIDFGVRAEDIDGDGLVDFLRSREVGSTVYNDLYLANGEVADLMISVATSQGAESEVVYASSANGENPELPFVLQATQSVTTNDGLGNGTTKTYTYADGDYFYDDAFNRGFAGFGVVTAEDDEGATITYFSQGNTANTAQGEATDSEAQMGRVYRIERADDTGHVYQTIIDTWEVTSIGTDRDFVLRSQTLELLYGSGSSHVDRATTYDYDASGNLIEQVELGEGTGADDGSFTDSGTDDRTTEWEYATFTSTSALSSYKKLERLTDHGGAQVRFTCWYYDGLSHGSVDEGLLSRTSQSVSTSTYYDTTFTYDAYGVLASSTDPASYTTTYAPDTYNLYPATVTNALSQDTTYAYDYSSGQVSETTDQNGTATTVTYDALDRPVQNEVTTSSTVTVAQYTYDDSSLPHEIHATEWFDGSTARESYTYVDGLGRTVQVRAESETSGTYNVIDTTFDERGRVASISLPYEDSGSAYTSPTTDADLLATTEYDALDRITATTNIVGTTTIAYSGREEETTDVNGGVITRTYDALGRLASVAETIGSSMYTTSYGYSAADHLEAINDPAGNVRNFTYDQRGGRLTATDLHAGSDGTYGTWTYTYNSRGLTATAVSPDSITTTYTYDDLGRKTAEDYSGSTGTEITLAYDSCTNGVGYLCTATVTGGVTTSYTYDGKGNIASQARTIGPNTYTTAYTYDRQNGIATVTYPDASTATNTLDVNGSLDAVDFVDGRTSASATAVSGITYGPHGKPTEVTYANGAVTTYTYDDTELYRLSNLNTVSGSTTLQDFTYGYDDVGNITSIDDASDLYANMSIAYTYDDRSLLTGATATSTDTALAYTKTWTYSDIGNIATSTDCGTYTYGGTGAGNYANPHAPTAACSTSFTYNHSGMLTGDGTWTHHRSPINLLGQSTNGSTTVNYKYDENGNRVLVASNVSGVTETPNDYYTRDGSTYERNIIAGDLGTVATSTYVVPTSTASLIYHHKDHLGGTHVESNASGTSVQYILYTPFGATLIDNKTGVHDNDHKYTNKEKDQDTGLYYYGARYYNPTIGVFLSEDPVYLGVGSQEPQKAQDLLQDPTGLNSYAYARNNPIALIDPDGNWFTNPTLLNKIFSFFGFGEHTVERTVMSVVADQASQPVTVDTLTEHITNAALGMGGIRPVVGSVVNSLGDDVARVASKSDIAKTIANGHAYNKHVVERGEFGSIISREDYAGRINSIMNSPSEVRGLERGRTAYWDDSTGAVVIHDPSSVDQGTALVPENGKTYFDNLQ